MLAGLVFLINKPLTTHTEMTHEHTPILKFEEEVFRSTLQALKSGFALTQFGQGRLRDFPTKLWEVDVDALKYLSADMRLQASPKRLYFR